MTNEDSWCCCMCPKSKASKHEHLWSFGINGNNDLKREDGLKGNQYCEEHFEIKDVEFNSKSLD